MRNMTQSRYLLALAVAAFLLAHAGRALAAPEDQAPIDISAQQSLEWYKEAGLYVARGAARAVRGDMSVEADTLEAHRAPDGGAVLYFVAEGNVRIADGRQRLFGDRAFYDAEKGLFKITGKNLRYEADQGIVTAKDSIEYHEGKNIALARGRALADQEGNKIEADIISATFGKNEAGRMVMKKMMAQGNVVIVTKQGDVARSRRAVYDMARNVAILLEGVSIKQDATQLAGDQAEIDFKSGKSRILSNSSGARVRILLPAAPGGKAKGDKK